MALGVAEGHCSQGEQNSDIARQEWSQVSTADTYAESSLMAGIRNAPWAGPDTVRAFDSNGRLDVLR